MRALLRNPGPALHATRIVYIFYLKEFTHKFGLDSPELEKALTESLDGITELCFDFEKLEYISSAGLRVLLAAQKIMNKQGTMKVIHAGEAIMEIFEVTGFTDVLTIE